MAGAGHHPRARAQQGEGGRRAPAAAPRTVRHLPSGLTVRTTEAPGRARVTVQGEVDLDSAGTLREALAGCLAATPRAVEIDLTGTGFFDCAGLNVLLRALAQARAADVALTVTAMSPAVARVLDLTHCRELLSDTPLPTHSRAGAEAGCPGARAGR